MIINSIKKSFTTSSILLTLLLFVIVFIGVIPLVLCLISAGLAYLLNFIFPVIGIKFYFIGAILCVISCVFHFTYGEKSKKEDQPCEDRLASAVEKESRYERRHSKSKK